MSDSAMLHVAEDRPSAIRMADMRPLLARHAFALALAIALGALLVFPRWWMLSTDPAEGVRVPVSVFAAYGMGSDEALQTTTIRDAYDGELPVRSPHLVNHRNDSLQAGAGWQQFVGIAGHVFGGPFESLAVITSVMAVAAFVMLYVLAYGLTGSRLAGAAVLPLAALFAHMSYGLDEYTTRESWRYVEPLLSLQTRREFLAWSRFLSPIMTLATFFTLAFALPRAAKTGQFRWCALASGVLALLVYSYVFYWTAAALAIACWLGMLVVRREFDAARRVVLVGVAAVLIALPEFAIVANKSLESTADIQARVGQGALRIVWVESSEILVRLLVGLPFLLALRRRTIEGGFFIALFVAPLILDGIGGIVPQPWHFRSQVWSAFAIPAFIAGGTEYVRRIGGDHQRLVIRAGAVAAVVAFAYLVAFQVRATLLVDDAYAVADDEYAAFKWIEHNVSGDETVASPSIITTLNIDNLTPASGYIIGGYNPVADDDELIDRYLRIQATYGYGEDATFARLDPRYFFDAENLPWLELQRQVEGKAAYYTFYWEIFAPDTFEERIPAWRAQFRALSGQDNVIAAYPVDYLYCGPRERFWPAVAPAHGTYVKPAFESGTVTVYRVADAADSQAKPFEGC